MFGHRPHLGCDDGRALGHELAYPEKLTKGVERGCSSWHNSCAINKLSHPTRKQP